MAFFLEIVLKGADVVQSELEAMAHSGQASIDELVDAADKAGEKLGKLAVTAKKLDEGFAEFGANLKNFGKSWGDLEKAVGGFIRGTTAFVATIGGATAAVYAFAASAVKAADDLQDNAEALGLNVQQYQLLSAAAADAGVSQQAFSRGFSQFSQQAEKNARGAAKAMLDFVEATGKVDAKRFPGIRDVQPIVNSFKAVTEGAQKLQKELSAKGIFRSLHDVQQELGRLATGTEKQRHEFEQLTGIELPGASEGLKKLREQAEGGKSAFERLGVQTRLTETGQIDLMGTLEDVADAFQKVKDPAKQNSIAIQLFGRQAGPKLAALLREGSIGLQDLITQLRASGAIMEDFTGADEGAKAIAKFELALKNLRLQLGLVFAPSLIAVADGFRSIINDNRSALVGWAQDIQSRLIPWITAFFDVLAGRGDDSNQYIQTWSMFFTMFKDGWENVKSAITTIVVPLFKGFMKILDDVAKVVNSVFGTNFTGPILLAALAVGRLTGAFRLLGAATRVVFSGMTLIAGVIGWPATLTAALILLVTYFVDIDKWINNLIKGFNELFGTNIPANVQGAAAAVATFGLAMVAAKKAVDLLGLSLTSVMQKNLFLRLLTAGMMLYDLLQKFATKDIELVDPKTGQVVGKLGDEVDETAQKTSDLEKELKSLGQASQNTGGKVNQLANSQRNASNTTNQLANNTNKGTDSMDKYIRKVGQASDALEKNIKTVPKAEETKNPPAAQAAKSVTDAVNESSGALEKATQQGVKFGEDTKKSLAGLDKVIKGNLSAPIDQVEKDVQSLITDTTKTLNQLPETLVWADTRLALQAVIEQADLALKKLAELKQAAATPPPAPAAVPGVPGAPAAAGQTFDQKFQEATQGLNQVGQAEQDLKTKTDELDVTLQKISLRFEEIGQEGAGDLVNVFQETTQTLGGFSDQAQKIADTIQQIFNSMVSAISNALENTRAVMTSVQSDIEAMMAAVTASIERMVQQTMASLDQLIAKAREAAAAAQAAAAAAAAASGGGGGGGGGNELFARGGQVFGRKGKDVVPAWLTAGEYVMKTSSVRKYGVGFMNAINQGLLRVPKFNMGGLADGISRGFSVPRMASGGLVPAAANERSRPGDTFWIGVPGVGRIGPLTGGPGVTEQLQRASIKSTLKSAGRTPRKGA